MPRKTRMYIPGVPAHIVQRGNNRQACFFSDADYLYYQKVLGEGLRRYGADLHAYCLMGNHVHLLITPNYEDSISRVIQHLGRQYVQYINRNQLRSGTLWEGRHKGSVIDAEPYLLNCYRYIELNPVRASIVACPEQYRWTSYHYNALGKKDPLITEHPIYQQLGVFHSDKRDYYGQLVQLALDKQVMLNIGECLSANRVLGGARFRQRVEADLGRRFNNGALGRPTGQK
jgi:putative transposase